MLSLFRRPAPGFIRSCNVFIPAGSGPLLVAAAFNHGGLFAEQPGEVARLEGWTPLALGEAIQAAMARCVLQPDFDYRQTRLTDWPAYQASGCRSVNQFQREHVQLLVQGANEQNLSYTVSGPELGPNQMHLTCSVSASSPPEAIGGAVLSLRDRYLVLSVA